MTKKLIILFLILAFFLSRLFFLNGELVFFDSPEYFQRLNNPNFGESLVSGHAPFHAGFILLAWPFFHLGKICNLEPILTTQILAVLTGFLAVFYFYKLGQLLFNSRLALAASLLACLTPLFWISNVSVMTESIYLCFLNISFYYWALYWEKNKNILLFFACFFLLLAYLTHTIIILCLPVYLGIYLLDKKPKKIFAGLLGILGSLVLGFLIIFYLSQLNQPSNNQIIFSSFGNLGQHFSASFSWQFAARSLRNWSILLLRSNTSLIVILAFISLINLYLAKKIKLFLFFILWLIPSVVANQLWDAVLFGRHGLTAVFPLCLLVTLLFNLNKQKNLFLLLLAITGLTSLGTLILLKEPAPYLKIQASYSQIPQGLLLETHYARPFTAYRGKIIIINEPFWPAEKIEEIINQSLVGNQPVFATSQALADPYGLYTGPYLAPLSLNPKGQPELKRIFNKYDFVKYKTVDENQKLFIYQIKNKTNDNLNYQNFSIPYFSRYRIDFFDPVTQVWFLLVKLTS